MNTSEKLGSFIGEMREKIDKASKFCSDTDSYGLEGRSMALDKIEATPPSDLPQAIGKMIEEIDEESRKFYPVEYYCSLDGSREVLKEIQTRFFPIKK